MGHIREALEEGQYLTVEGDADAEITIQRSRFIASLRRIQSRSDFDEKMREISLRYPRATHYCWAYRFASAPPLEHASDAGEPAGTAGRPILGALKKHALLNVMGVVTRYYGGVKLGVRGLISAYGESTLMAIAASRIVVAEACSLITFSTTYDLYNILLSRLNRLSIGNDAMRVNFSEGISGEIIVPNSILAALKREFDAIAPGSNNLSYDVRAIDG